MNNERDKERYAKGEKEKIKNKKEEADIKRRRFGRRFIKIRRLVKKAK